MAMVGVLAVLQGCQRHSDGPAGSQEAIGTSVAALSADAGVDAGPASPAIGSFAVYATEAIELNSGALVTGCNVGVENTTGPFLGGGAAAYFNSGAKIQTSQTLYAYSVYLNSGATLGPVDTDHVMGNSGASYGPVSTFPAMPAPPALPPATPGTTSVTLNSGASKTLAAGAYSSVTVNSGATLSLTGGSYVFSSLTMNSGGTLAVSAPTTISVTGSSSFGSGSFTGPASSSGLTAKALELYFNSSSAININSGAKIQALVVATNALVTVNTANFTGALAAAQVVMNSGATVTCQDSFGAVGCATGCTIGGACVAAGTSSPTNPCETCQPSASTTQYSPASNGTACSDGNACDLSDTCQSGVCTAGSQVTCTAPDSCHTAGTCNSATGTCSAPTLNAGYCDIGGACVAAGASNGSNTCETCQPSVSTSQYSSVANGTSCNDGNACDLGDTCQAGTCTASSQVTCTAPDSCHTAGTCDPSTGACSAPTLNAGYCDIGGACVAAGAANGRDTCATCQPSVSTTQYTSVANGTSCSDGNACDLADTCQSGACVAGSQVICASPDSCHTAGTCNPSTGACSAPTLNPGYCSIGGACVAAGATNGTNTCETCQPAVSTAQFSNVSNGTSCSDGNACDLSDTCQSGACTAGSHVTCTAPDSCHTAGTCNSSTGVCSAPTLNAGYCDIGGACVAAGATNGTNTCGTCQPAVSTTQYSNVSNGTSCSDGNSCDLNDTCQSGACTAGSHVTCTAPDSCHTAGTCNASTGVCSAPTLNAGYCDIGGACVASGATNGTNTCETCQPAVRTTQFSNVSNGTSCSDGNACDLNDTCQAGACTAGSHVTCAAPDSCHTAGTCNASTGVCSAPTLNAGFCSIGGACVAAGAANGTNTCATCQPAVSTTQYTNVSNGASCNDGNACDSNDTCQAGVCTAGSTLTCTASDQCHAAGTCNPTTGQCSNPPVANGTSCNDGNACDSNDTCQTGVCTAGSTVTCSASDQCHVAGTCNPTTGQCSNPTATDGTTCNDGNLCDLNDTCLAGVCTAGGSVSCVASDQCHLTGTCSPTTGQCSNPTVADGTSCNDGNACDLNDTCQAGTCTADGQVTCTASDQCHAVGTCNPSTGACSNPSLPNGTACNDNNLCTSSDQCTSGVCGGTAVACTASDACHTAGTCNPATGACSNPQIPLPAPTSECDLVTCNPSTGAAQFTCSPIDMTATSTITATASFLYSGANAIQPGVDAGAITPTRTALLRGQVLDTSSNPLEGITISIVGHPEFGTTTSLVDGTFAMAVNGGGALVVSCSAARYLTVQRTLPVVPWNQYTQVPALIMTALDPAATVVNVSGSGSASYQVARGTTQTDSSGTRTATLLVPPGTTASFVTGSTSTPATTLTLRATEYSVGPNGPMAMPGDLPKTSGYTYAVELSADEAIANGSTLTFSSPIVSYTDNFLGFTAGEAVPVGYYSRTLGQWVATTDGIVLTIVSISNGVASIDITGDGIADPPSELEAAGISAAEQEELATIYTAPTSLWRVSIPHFSAWDFNWPFAPPPDAGPPPGPPPAPPPDPPDPPQCKNMDNGSGPNASSIECQNGILHESIPIAGTPYSLVYSSDRVAGFKEGNRIDIPLSGATMPPGVLDITMEVDLAGRSFFQTFPATPNQTTTFDWDGNDAFGRAVQGTQIANVAIGYVYQGVYLTPGENPLDSAYNALFGHYSYYGTPATGDRARQEVTLLEEAQSPIGYFHSEALGLGGWTLNVQHVYEPATEILRLGDGTRQPGNTFGKVVTAFAGGGSTTLSTGSLPATSAHLYYPEGVAVLPNGSVLIADTGNNCIDEVSLSGTITTVAGSCTRSSDFTPPANNVPATQARLSAPFAVVAAPDGSFYIADAETRVVSYVNASGTLFRFAGTGAGAGTTSGTYYSGDGGPATSAELSDPAGLFLAADGSLYIADTGNCAIRRVDPAGLISTVAGTGVCGFSGDGGQATQAKLNAARSMVVTPDGRLYIADALNNRIRMVGTDGTITTIAGTGAASFSGDGGPATSAALNEPENLALGIDGTLYVADSGNWRIRAITTGGVIYSVAGNGTKGSSGDNGPALDATFDPGYPSGSPYLPGSLAWAMSFSPDGQFLYMVDGNGITQANPALNYRVRRLQFLQPGFTATAFSIAAQDGSEVYGFDEYGRHLTTTSLPTNAPTATFGYGAFGTVQTITDANGNVTTINRDSSGNPTGITGPYGVTTSLALGSDGYLASITGPAGAQYAMVYENGLLTAIQFPTGSPTVQSTKTYDSLGRLATSTDAAGHALFFTRAPDAETSISVTKTTTLGVTTQFDVALPATGAQTWTNALPDGTTMQAQVGADGSQTTTAPDGTITTYNAGPDPRFGMQVPLTASMTVETPSGLTETTSMTRAVTLSNASNPLSLVSETDTTTVNGHAWTTVYTASTLTSVLTTPMGRTTTTVANAAAQPTQISMPEIAASVFGYDAHGRLTTTTQGTFVSGTQTLPRTWTQAYDSNGYLNSSTDPIGVATDYLNDLAGRPTDTFLPAGPNNTVRDVKTTYDGDNDLTSETLPNGNLHQLTYTPVDALASYAPPSLGSGTWTTTDAYDGDGRISLETRPDGSTISYAYDSAGRLSTTSYPQGMIGDIYSPTTGKLTALTMTTGEDLAFTYDGFLAESSVWSGPVAGTVAFGYDNTFRVTSQTVSGAAVSFGYDNDNLMTTAGMETITRDAQNGRVTGTTLGAITDAYSYDANGQLASYVASDGSTTLYSETINARDGDGRIMRKADFVNGVTHVWAYGYDAAGRLTNVSEDGTETAQYSYDADDNRTTVMSASGTTSATYDAQDRLLTYGSATYTFGANGELQGKTVGGETTSYAYDVFGNLLSATLPSGTALAYVVDGQNRRVGTEVNGALTTGFLYQNQLNVIAQLNGSGTVVSRFVFGSKANVPDYVTTSAGTFRVLSDHLGSPRLVVNTANGSVVEEIDYDEFGNVTNDTAPGTIPFGFAGGLRDLDTGLVRFGARDYDPSVGLWTSKDPIRFDGGQTNLYAYVGNDPNNHMDGTGQTFTFPIPAPIPGPTPCPHINKQECLDICQSTFDTCISNKCPGGGVPGCDNPCNYQLTKCALRCKPLSDN